MVGIKYVVVLLVCGFVIRTVFSQLVGYMAGVDYPTYDEVPRDLSFKCKDHIPGYYADPDTRCQVWHWCLPNGGQYSFLCPNGTMFNQLVRVCDWFFNVDCPNSAQHYNINEDLYKIPERRPSVSP